MLPNLIRVVQRKLANIGSKHALLNYSFLYSFAAFNSQVPK